MSRTLECGGGISASQARPGRTARQGEAQGNCQALLGKAHEREGTSLPEAKLTADPDSSHSLQLTMWAFLDSILGLLKPEHWI